MSTTAKILGTEYRPNEIYPRKKSPREIVREELKRQKELEKLEEQHKAGEISDFSYRAQKFLLKIEPALDAKMYSTTA